MLAGLFEGDVLTAWGRLSGSLEGLHPEERRWAESVATARRRAEIATGRRLARGLLARLGIEGHALLPDASRAPRWPAGVVGTISHKGGVRGSAEGGVCGVVVARSRDGIAGLGLDVELAEPLPERLWRRALTAGERAWLEGRDASERGFLARTLWAARECAFKALGPVVSPDPPTGGSVGKLSDEPGPFLVGVFLVTRGWSGGGARGGGRGGGRRGRGRRCRRRGTGPRCPRGR